MVGEKLVATEDVEEVILYFRGQRVIIDTDLARLYGVSTKQLNQQVKRNKERFPEDFMFQLTTLEKDEAVTKCDRLVNLKFSTTKPFVFTEHGAIMAASVLNSKYAVDMSIYIVRAFVKIRRLLVDRAEIAAELIVIENKLAAHDKAIISLMSALRQLLKPQASKKRHPIGFRSGKSD